MNSTFQITTKLFRRSISIAIILMTAVFMTACATVPVTGRSQLLLVNEQQEIALGIKSYNQILEKARLSRDRDVIDMVNRVGRRIAAAANRPDYDWEFNVIDEDKTANAFALPGGKIAVYTGILPYTRTESGLAFVLAHEVGHAIARHGGERMSQQLLIQLGQEGLNIAIGSKSPAAIQAVNQAYGVASQIGIILPFSRQQEYEADHIGLILMAKAGYDPRQAPDFFKRMAADKKQTGPPTFLSTHPADALRIQTLYELIPEALQYYRPAGQ